MGRVSRMVVLRLTLGRPERRMSASSRSRSSAGSYRGVAGPRSSIGARAVASRGAICTCVAWSSGVWSTIKGHSARHAPACGGLLKGGTSGSSIVRFGLAWGCRPRIGFRFRVIPGILGRSRILGSSWTSSPTSSATEK
jgi:hypothetical protein